MQVSSEQALCTLAGKAWVILLGHTEETSHTFEKQMQARKEDYQGVSTFSESPWVLLYSYLLAAAAASLSKRATAGYHSAVMITKSRRRLNYILRNYWQ